MYWVNKLDINDPRFNKEIDLINPKITCPAIILADKRTARVSGRMIILIDSIITIKNINPIGQPKGTKCLKRLFIWCIAPYNIILVHNNNLKENETEIWLEAAIT